MLLVWFDVWVGGVPCNDLGSVCDCSFCGFRVVWQCILNEILMAQRHGSISERLSCRSLCVNETTADAKSAWPRSSVLGSLGTSKWSEEVTSPAGSAECVGWDSYIWHDVVLGGRDRVWCLILESGCSERFANGFCGRSWFTSRSSRLLITAEVGSRFL